MPFDGQTGGAAGFALHGIAPPVRFRAGARGAPRSSPEWQNACLSTRPIPEETRVVVLNGNRLEEFDFETSTKKQIKGNIYLAKVTRVEPSLQAAFVEYGGNRHGFLAFNEIHPDYYRIPVADRAGCGLESPMRAAETRPTRARRPARRATSAAEPVDAVDTGREDGAETGEREPSPKPLERRPAEPSGRGDDGEESPDGLRAAQLVADAAPRSRRVPSAAPERFRRADVAPTELRGIGRLPSGRRWTAEAPGRRPRMRAGGDRSAVAVRRRG